jgi:hypothetical protein
MTTATRAKEGIGIGKDEMGMDGIGRCHGRVFTLTIPCLALFALSHEISFRGFEVVDDYVSIR